MKKLNFVFFTLFFLVANAIGVFGCICSAPPEDAKEAKRWSQAVFSGEVIAFEKEGDNGLFTFKVERVWKGVIEKQLVLADLMYQSSCDNGLKVGQRYIVFASYQFFDLLRFPEGKYLSLDKNSIPRPVIDTCSWSTNLADTKRSNLVLKKIGKGRLIKMKFRAAEPRGIKKGEVECFPSTCLDL